MKTTLLSLALLQLSTLTSAFPSLLVEHALENRDNVEASLKARVDDVALANIERLLAITEKNKKRKRLLPAFDAKSQLVSTSGTHQFVAPKDGDLRGPCPGLNAMANHGYLPHNGIGTIDQFVTQTFAVFGMGVDISTVLAILGAVEDGDLTKWSIGGAPKNGGLLNTIGLTRKPKGLNGSHNKYETDASPTRGDLYERGDNVLLQMDQFEELFNLQPDAATADYTYDVLTEFRATRFKQSVQRNPFFFYGPGTGILVEAAPYFFIPRFMGNKSAEFPEGKLNQEVLKSFFAITGDGPGSFTYTPGHERIPDNWYKRAIGSEYTIASFATDIVNAAKKHPEFISVGGNTGKVNSFSGINLGDFSGGLYNSKNLLEGNNALCLAFQALQALAPDMLKGILGSVLGPALQLLYKTLGDAFNALACPQQLGDFDTSALQQFPGYTKVKSDGTY